METVTCGKEGLWTRRDSGFDCSVNWTKPVDVGIVETRFVRRRDDYFIIYLSSQTGCNQACKMCHLTETRQTRFNNVTLSGYLEQAEKVFEHYDAQDRPARIVHFNFMARGEPLANECFLRDNQTLFKTLGKMSRDRGLYPRFLVSTVLPKSLGNPNLVDVFPIIHPDIYYSIYSLKDEFRRRWLPKAMSGFDGLRLLKTWQRYTKKIPKLHFAFISGQNDTEGEVRHMAQIVKDLDLRVDLNVVRYNPQNSEFFETEEDRIYELTHVFREVLPETKVKIVPRVGFDVKASCGMFIS